MATLLFDILGSNRKPTTTKNNKYSEIETSVLLYKSKAKRSTLASNLLARTLEFATSGIARATYILQSGHRTGPSVISREEKTQDASGILLPRIVYVGIVLGDLCGAVHRGLAPRTCWRGDVGACLDEHYGGFFVPIHHCSADGCHVRAGGNNIRVGAFRQQP